MRHFCKLSAAVVVAIVVPAFAQSTPQKAESAAAGNANVSITPRARTGAPEATESIADRRSDIRVDTTLVLIPVSVTDPASRFVTGLDKETSRSSKTKWNSS